jgi:hypothetical protein
VLIDVGTIAARAYAPTTMAYRRDIGTYCESGET